MQIIKRFIDIFFSLLFIIVTMPAIIALLIIVYFNSSKIFYISKRIGKNKKIFLMPKFRTMVEETPQLATHLMTNPDKYYTKIGFILRKYSLDEIPQL